MLIRAKAIQEPNNDRSFFQATTQLEKLKIFRQSSQTVFFMVSPVRSASIGISSPCELTIATRARANIDRSRVDRIVQCKFRSRDCSIERPLMLTLISKSLPLEQKPAQTVLGVLLLSIKEIHE